MGKQKRKGTGLIIIIALVVIGGGLYLLFGRSSKQLQLNTQTVAEGAVEITVMATGTLQPVDKVEVGTQVSGIIEKIYVDFNSVVKANELLAELDTQTLSERVTQAEASLKSAEADVRLSQANYDRTLELFNAEAATQVAMDEAENSRQRARTELVNATANLSQAKVNLGYASITSPIDGVVLERAVEEGQTVAASFSTPTLFTIARDLTKMQVEAAVDEADIGKVRLGQSVKFNVDAYSADVFNGIVHQIRIQPVTTNNVVTYTVIIEAPNPDLKLFPGMTANVYIVTDRQEGLTVPVEATYFTMSADVAKAMEITVPPPPAPADRSKTRVWAKGADGWQLREITTGLSDGVNIVVTEGVAADEEVILSASLEKAKTQKGTATRNPLMPSGRRR